MTRSYKWKKLLPERIRHSSKARRLIAAGLVAGLLASCSTLNYYAQAAHGQLALLSDARPVDDWLADVKTDAKLRKRLESARKIRAYAVAELGLPDNQSYKNYASLQRPFVLWNVVATPELSLKPMQWCFPIAGCVAYRGYYSKDDAQTYAKELRADGNDVQVGGVPAYSTLGWFNDPLVSTFINYPDAELARLIFHELAHQVAYIAGDSQFNESFATTVEEEGVKRWLDAFGNDQMRDAYTRYSSRKKDFLRLLLDARAKLDTAYKAPTSVEQKRADKARIFQELKDEYQVLKEQWGGYAGYDRFFNEPLSNAHLASIATYNDYVPAFRALLAKERTFPRFYAAVKQLSTQDKAVRDRRLKALAPPTA
ncbi:aminopeptidase [Massilia arenosa]|uniref:Aminopeptidase n=1 Tax=Zemynaea arenosa TaxID=2561931 RepID=A0A4Y9SK16_9BURK|nr:aminopeptidase [Massilia arenosa]TFW26249.1 aminopeptidase [Massilia arenosa]